MSHEEFEDLVHRVLKRVLQYVDFVDCLIVEIDLMGCWIFPVEFVQVVVLGLRVVWNQNMFAMI